MLLRESLGLHQAAEIIEASLAEVWRQGFRTADLAEPGCEILGTKAITERFVQQILRAPEVKRSHETCAATG
jgi:3-isopropylmalate dehydrogenase